MRLDTSATLVDKSLFDQMGTFDPTGVNAQLVLNVRRGLDEAGFKGVKIIVSGGFNVEKIRAFESANIPVDAYAVGSVLFEGKFDFTADNPGLTLFHCHQQLHMDFGFMAMFDYI